MEKGGSFVKQRRLKVDCVCACLCVCVCVSVCFCVLPSCPTSDVQVCRRGVAHALRVGGHALVLPLVRLLAVLDLQRSCKRSSSGLLGENTSLYFVIHSYRFFFFALFFLSALLFRFDPWMSSCSLLQQPIKEPRFVISARHDLNRSHSSTSEVVWFFLFLLEKYYINIFPSFTQLSFTLLLSKKKTCSKLKGSFEKVGKSKTTDFFRKLG